VRAEASPPAAVEPRASGNEIVLDAVAQQQGGIVVETIEPRSLPQLLRASGRITENADRTWRVGAVTEGRVIRVFVNPGDRVQAGAVLARMHSHDIHESRALYRRAVSELARLRSVESYARVARDRARRLYELKAASLQQVEHAETELANARTEVSNAEIEVRRTHQHLVEFLQIPAEEPKDHKEGDEEHDDDLIPVRAPASGVVLDRKVTSGTVVTAGGDLFVISDLSTLWMIAAVSEEHLPRLRPGMPVRVFVQAYADRPFPGRIARLGEELDATTRTIQARVSLPNGGGQLKPEMYATCEIQTGGSHPALLVPQSAPQEVKGQTALFVRKASDRFELRPVELGRAAEGAVEVVRGLAAGENVVTRGSFLLKSQLLKSSLTEE
jgi:cobalt-zinc-cadmium efflux system membrane fusion protein